MIFSSLNFVPRSHTPPSSSSSDLGDHGSSYEDESATQVRQQHLDANRRNGMNRERKHPGILAVIRKVWQRGEDEEDASGSFSDLTCCSNFDASFANRRCKCIL